MRTILATLWARLFGTHDDTGGSTLSSPIHSLSVGRPTVFEFKSPMDKLSVVFEDDGSTGYFYALDYTRNEQPVQEVMHIYCVNKLPARDTPASLRVVWSQDGARVGLWINGAPQGVFDFAARRGYCRSNFPAPANWNSHDFAWNDDALAFFQ
jgi:hypothetical protein